MASSRISLLARVAYRFSNQRELVATSSLAHILDSSEAAKAALQNMLKNGGANIGAIERVADEVDLGDSRVDLVAFDKAGKGRLFIEAKFWANLTENQPGSYLTRLPDDGQAAVLLFVAPEVRLDSLWPLLQRRAAQGGLHLEVRDDAGELRTAAIEGGRHLMLTSWRALLGAMAASVGYDPIGEDIRQLRGLCEREDTEAFLPLRADELSPEIPRRLLDLGRLVDRAVERLIEEGFANKKRANKKRLQAGVTASYFGTYLHLGSKAKGVWAGAWFGVVYKWWREEGHPLWIEFDVWDDTMPATEIEKRLGYQLRWIDIPVGKEYDDVLDSVVNDLRKHAQRLAGEISNDDWAKYMSARRTVAEASAGSDDGA